MRAWRLLIVVFAALLAGSAAADPPVSFPTGSLEIATSGGARLTLAVEIATTRAQLSQGLMYRRALAADAGMLFDFGQVQTVTMWMKNTLIPLDMVFIAADGTVAGIAERTVPMSQTVIPSPGPVKAVLELNGGATSRLGIKTGDQVVHPIFGGIQPGY